MKLPKSKQYFGYSNENGVLYFIHSNVGNEKFITKFHKSFKNRGHMIVPKSKRSNTLMKEILSEVSEQFQYRHGVLMGNFFWTFGGNITSPVLALPNIPPSHCTTSKRKLKRRSFQEIAYLLLLASVI